LDQPGLVEMIERAGLQVAVEDECLGARHFDRLVFEGGDPFESIAARYLTRWPCARMKGYDRRLSHLESLIDESGVNGIIAVQLKFCDQSGFDLPIIKARMEDRGVPLLIVENDYIQGSMGQLRVRIEAFAEMLEQAWVE
jgi:benzoyl-CoA reductase/2-hydroxyglutaryl-CoA dehydratase subunit BcrC/BadD/HgdB